MHALCLGSASYPPQNMSRSSVQPRKPWATLINLLFFHHKVLVKLFIYQAIALSGRVLIRSGHFYDYQMPAHPLNESALVDSEFRTSSGGSRAQLQIIKFDCSNKTLKAMNA